MMAYAEFFSGLAIGMMIGGSLGVLVLAMLKASGRTYDEADLERAKRLIQSWAKGE